MKHYEELKLELAKLIDPRDNYDHDIVCDILGPRCLKCGAKTFADGPCLPWPSMAEAAFAARDAIWKARLQSLWQQRLSQMGCSSLNCVCSVYYATARQWVEAAIEVLEKRQ